MVSLLTALYAANRLYLARTPTVFTQTRTTKVMILDGFPPAVYIPPFKRRTIFYLVVTPATRQAQHFLDL